MTAHCNRVPVEDGHTECVSIKLGQARPRAKSILAAWAEFQPLAGQNLPMAPAAAGGVGRRRTIVPSRALTAIADAAWASPWADCAPAICWTGSSLLLSHNTIRGAAGATILNAELLASLGKLEAGCGDRGSRLRLVSRMVGLRARFSRAAGHRLQR